MFCPHFLAVSSQLCINKIFKEWYIFFVEDKHTVIEAEQFTYFKANFLLCFTVSKQDWTWVNST